MFIYLFFVLFFSLLFLIAIEVNVKYEGDLQSHYGHAVLSVAGEQHFRCPGQAERARRSVGAK